MKKNKKAKKKKISTISILALIFAFISLSMGFLAISTHLKVQSELTAHPDELNFRVVFSSKYNKVDNKPIIPETFGNNIIATNGIIINSSSPIITNLGANFTEPGQKVKYDFYIYNTGEYTGYLNHIVYENLGRSNTPKLCVSKDGTISDSIRKACNNIKISVKIGDVVTSKSLYYINNRFLRPRTAQPIEVTIEYLQGTEKPNESFDVFFGDIRLYYSMFDNESSHVS